MSKWIVALSVILPTLIEVIDTSVVNVSLDHIRGSLSAGLDESTWTITAYLVSNAIIIPITGWLSRVFGRKRYLIFSVALFTASSFMCGASTTLGMLIFFRILQGIGGGALQPISQSILLEAFPVAEHGMAMAIFGSGVMFGPIIGPMLGGWITDNWSWNWIFYINIPIGILSIVMIGLFIHDPVYLKRTKQKIDFRGLGLLVVGLGALQVVLDKGQREDWFSSGLIVRLSLVAAACLIAFIIVELRSPEPVVKLRLFKNISFAAGNLVQFFAFFVLFGSIVLVPIYLQQLMGYTAYLAGLALAPGGIATLFSMPLVGILVAKYNPKGLMVFGIIVTAYSMLIMSSFSLQTDLDAILWSRIVMGFGLSFVFIPMVTMTLSGVPKEEMGYATAIFNLLRNLGGSFGVAFITTIVARRAQFHQARFAENLTPFHLPYRAAGQFAGRVLQSKGVSPAAADGIIYQRLIRESNMMAFRDTFFFSAVIMISVLLLVFFLKRPKGAPAVGAMH